MQTFEKHVSWMPGMSVVRLRATCELVTNDEDLTRLNNEINMFIRDAKEHCLREIANDSINTIMIVNPKRYPQGGGMYGQHTNFKAEVMAVDYGGGVMDNAADVMHIDELEGAMHSAIWKHVVCARNTYPSTLGKCDTAHKI
jgi:hypothetical protein